ncbi:MAG: GNAT family N-acetyltransferase [Oscillospiraceae bacterium]
MSIDMLTGIIIPLLPENYRKCHNIWDMDRQPQRTKGWYDELLSGNRIIFVYEEDGAYLGEVALVLDNGDPGYTIPGRRVYLSRMVVKESERGRGIGGKLIDHAVSRAREMGFREMALGVDIVNVGARWLYEKKGFTSTIFVGEDSDGKYVKLLKKL